MTASDWIAIGALSVSLFSLFVSHSSKQQSSAAERRAAKLQKQETKVEVLSLLSDCRAILNRTYGEIGALKADYDAESQPVRTILESRTNLFSKYLPDVIATMESIEGEWAAVHAWKDEISHDDLLRRKSEIRDKVNDFQYVDEVAVEQVVKFRQEIDRARSYTRNATRG